jgi:hypothetical protein
VLLRISNTSSAWKPRLDFDQRFPVCFHEKQWSNTLSLVWTRPDARSSLKEKPLHHGRPRSRNVGTSGPDAGDADDAAGRQQVDYKRVSRLIVTAT